MKDKRYRITRTFIEDGLVHVNWWNKNASHLTSDEHWTVDHNDAWISNKRYSSHLSIEDAKATLQQLSGITYSIVEIGK